MKTDPLPGEEGAAPFPTPGIEPVLPPDAKARRRAGTIAFGTLLIALLLHVGVFVALQIDWQGKGVAATKPLEVRLVQEPPKPPPPPKQPEKPKPPPPPAPPPPPPPPPTPPQPASVKPRESGEDQTTEAKKTEQPKPALPQAMIQPEPEPEKPETPPVPAPKPTPPKSVEKERAAGRGEVLPLPPLPPEAAEKSREAAPAHHNLTLRLPSPGGGTADQDRSGDAYLNALRALVERNRLYPDASEFHGAAQKLVIYSIVIEPNGTLDTITLIGPSGSSRIDEAARATITDSMPFPPLPADYEKIPTQITVVLPMYPRR